MSVTKSIVTSKFGVHSANLFLNSFSTDNYYMFFGKHLSYVPDDSTVEDPIDTEDNVKNIFNDMVFSKKINPTDVKFLIKNNEWEINTVYDEYSHVDTDLEMKNFYVVVNDDTEYNVYKCLSNNDGADSIIAPSKSGTSADLSPILTGDGYMWKYMFTIPKADYDKFATKSYVPVIANTSVIEGATPGTIDNIKIITPGAGYNNYLETASFNSGDIAVDGVTTIYKAPDFAVNVDDYYRGCSIKITSGPAINQYRKIVNYEGASLQKRFTIDSPFSVLPNVGDSYEIYPYVYVWGDGSETTSADGRAIINPIGNTVMAIEMLSFGENYRKGATVIGETTNDPLPTISSVLIELPTIITNSPNFEYAELFPIVSPSAGHGSSIEQELFANKIGISTKINQDEAGSIPIQNDFRQIGIIKNPLFNNVDILLEPGTTVGGFEIGETVHQFRQLKLAGTVQANTGNSYIYKTDLGRISSTVTILNGGIGYDNTSNNELVFNNTDTGGFGAIGTFANNANGTVTSITISNQGVNYDEAPLVSINPAAAALGSNGQFLATLSNPQKSTFDDAFESDDYCLISTDNNNHLSKILSVPSPNRVILTTNSSFTSTEANISALVLQASGTVTSIATNRITLSNVKGTFESKKKLLGLTTSTTALTQDSNAIQINDKSNGLFNTAVQLTRLVGDFSSTSSLFIEDEKIEQNSLLSFAKPEGYVHHLELNGGTDDDILFISNERGIFNLDPAGVKTILGTSSDASLDNLSNKYNGDFVKDSGNIIYYENIDAITRSDNKSEIIKIILKF